LKTIIRRPVIKHCPFRDETDAGGLVITFSGPAPELHELGVWVDTLAAGPISHEEFTAGIAELVPGAQVVTTWHTGPWTVECSDGAESGGG